MPERNKGEKLSDFIGRFMKAKQDKKWKPKQRLAVAYSEAKNRRA